MINFSEFHFGMAYQVAASTRDRIFGEDSLVDVSDFFTPDEKFQIRAMKPSKKTYLHDLIEHCLLEDMIYLIDKGGDSEATEQLIPALEAYDVKFPKVAAEFGLPEGEHMDDLPSLWVGHLLGLFQAEVVPKVTEETFTIMFADRVALRELNKSISKMIKGLKISEYPDLLQADGKVKRCEYWPKWLVQGLVLRDRARCVKCLSDLSGLLATGAQPEIDHIIPLNLGGTNDPTNLQILCNTCNGKKGGGRADTSKYQPRYWMESDE